MEVVSSYAVGIEKAGRKTCSETERVDRDAVSFLIGVYDREWSMLSAIGKATVRFNMIAEKSPASIGGEMNRR